MSLRETLDAAGWQQGTIIELKENKALSDQIGSMLEPHWPSAVASTINMDQLIAIVLTYDCAVVSDCLIKEPWLQLLIAWPVEASDPNYEYGKHPRQLHFEVNVGENVIFYECSAISLLQVSRQSIVNSATISSRKCTQDTVSILARWYSQRFLAPTFPTPFIDCLRPKNSRLKKLWKKEHVNALSAVYIDVDYVNDIYLLFFLIELKVKNKESLSGNLKLSC